MLADPTYRLDSAMRPDSDEVRFVAVDADGFLHPEATAWLQSLADAGRSAGHHSGLRAPSRVVSVVVRVDDGTGARPH